MTLLIQAVSNITLMIGEALAKSTSLFDADLMGLLASMPFQQLYALLEIPQWFTR